MIGFLSVSLVEGRDHILGCVDLRLTDRTLFLFIVFHVYFPHNHVSLSEVVQIVNCLRLEARTGYESTDECLHHYFDNIICRWRR